MNRRGFLFASGISFTALVVPAVGLTASVVKEVSDVQFSFQEIVSVTFRTHKAEILDSIQRNNVLLTRMMERDLLERMYGE